MRICPVCSSNNWEDLYSSTTNKIMTGDQRILEGFLVKNICKVCGAVANKNSFSNAEIEILYGDEYELNTLGVEEHYFYTDKGKVARSQAFFEWIDPFVQSEFDSLIEIGCGEGNLLSRFNSKYSNKKISGFDGSLRASKLAKEKDLNVDQKLIIGEEQLPNADVFLLINVIEHIENIPQLINTLKKSLNKEGRIIFCLPIQDYGGYDIFFAEHVWHFTSKHFENILKNNGLKLLHKDVNHPINHGIGLFVCEVMEKPEQPMIAKEQVIEENLSYWTKVFNKFNLFVRENKATNIVIFGAGELATLFLTFTDLGDGNVMACIDDTKPDGFKKHGIPVYKSEWLRNNNADKLLLAINTKYHQMVIDKFKDLNIVKLF